MVSVLPNVDNFCYDKVWLKANMNVENFLISLLWTLVPYMRKLEEL